MTIPTSRFSLTIRRWPKEQIAQRVSELAQLLGLQPLWIESIGLSGGEAQRVALGRAWRPPVCSLPG